MLVHFGRSPKSSFRLAGLLDAASARVPAVRGLAVREVFVVDLQGELTTEEQGRLAALLDYGDGESGPIPTTAVVAPRPGTVSPWSSKATDILHHAGLAAVRRVERVEVYFFDGIQGPPPPELAALLHDRMTQVVLPDLAAAAVLFSTPDRRPLRTIPVLAGGLSALREADAAMGLALSDDEKQALLEAFVQLGRDPTDAELMMYAQANSEHCRHKIFNASWTLDGEPQARSLFGMIKHTFATNPGRVLSAYSDNAAVMRGSSGGRFFPDPVSGTYRASQEDVHVLMKVETHNHPTAIAPHPGAGTGNGGEIRDEGATGRGAKPKAGLTGFVVSDLRIPGFEQPWERDHGRPGRIVSPLEIMLEGPIGGAAYNNEFGRPNLTGFFRTFELEVDGPEGPEVRGYHKPILIAGGLGNIRDEHVKKHGFPEGAALVVLGGPAMLIGLGGGAASSMASGASTEDLDFASVQRSNPEMERRCQEVIDRCWALGAMNPILSIHDVGAGGLSNAFPELVHDAGRGAWLDLRRIPSADTSLSPMELWCNESQERYVLAVAADQLPTFEAICERERAPYAVLGSATDDGHLRVDDEPPAVDLPLSVVLGKTPRMHREAARRPAPRRALDWRGQTPASVAERLLRFPTIAGKGFLVTIGDRSVTGLVARDQMVGPWQVPVADVAVTLTSYDVYTGEAMATGERCPIALLDPAASARLAVAEALMNLAAADVQLRDVALSANWMAAAGAPGEDAALFEAVRAVGEGLCPALGVPIPVGKDSLSMRTVWPGGRVVSPVSLIVSAFGVVGDARRTWTPQLRGGDRRLIAVDLGRGQNRLGGSCAARVIDQLGGDPPDLDDPKLLLGFFEVIADLRQRGVVSAYHDRSDGGWFVCAVEMAFAAHLGVDLDLAQLGDEPFSVLFAEEPGALLEVDVAEVGRVLDQFARVGVPAYDVGRAVPTRTATFRLGGTVILEGDAVTWHHAWAETSARIQAVRDEPAAAAEEHAAILDRDDPGLSPRLTFDPDEDVAAPYVARGVRPRMAILREQGVNGQIEMAAAFDRAGFDAVDVHMSDLLAGRRDLDEFVGLVACGGFSYGDVLGAGGGWARTILFQPRLRDTFAAFFARPDTLSLGICNGCQMMAHLAPLIPGAEGWPVFVRNHSEQFEARVCTLLVERSPSLLLQGMEGAHIPVAVAHGEGRAYWRGGAPSGIVAVRYVDNHGQLTQRYPLNPNGSPEGVAGLTSADGRATLMMPHPERVFRTVSNSWAPDSWGEDGPWMRFFRNARVAVG